MRRWLLDKRYNVVDLMVITLISNVLILGLDALGVWR